MNNAILIVEDEPGIASLIQDRLKDEGYDVRVANSGSEAIHELKCEKPDFITLDIYLPDANGLKILRDLKADPKTYRIPVVIISSSDEAKRAEALGAAGYVSKPIDFPKLFSIIKAAKERELAGV